MVPSQTKECWLLPEAAEVVKPCWHTYFFWPNHTDMDTLASRMITVKSMLSVNYQVCSNLLWKSLEMNTKKDTNVLLQDAIVHAYA